MAARFRDKTSFHSRCPNRHSGFLPTHLLSSHRKHTRCGNHKKGHQSFIKTLIKQIRSRQSYGIPVGGSASRLLAEAVLSDADSALADEGFLFTRFVDDYRLFLDSNQSPYSALAFIAEQLATS